MDDADRALIAALAQVRYQPGSFDKRFTRDMAARAGQDGAALSERQRACLERMRRHYRRQLRGINALLVADIDDAPTASERRRELEKAKLMQWEDAMKGEDS
jgi:nitrogenase molybdenum-iron protein alpha/beta subunit